MLQKQSKTAEQLDLERQEDISFANSFHLPPETVAEFREIFSLVDGDGSGSIESAEYTFLRNFLKSKF
jgi:Ca2+-binding EF-hand superfamily protein